MGAAPASVSELIQAADRTVVLGQIEEVEWDKDNPNEIPLQKSNAPSIQ